MTIKNPQHPQEITPEWLTFALRSGGVIKNASVKYLKREIIGTDRGFLSSAVRVNIEYDSVERGAPDSVVVKIEPESKKLQDIGYQLHAFEREILFYKVVSQNVPIRLPVLYYSVDEPPAYCMVMEDLSSFTPGDQVEGMTEDQVLSTVESMAKLQSRYWDNTALDTIEWMPTTNNIYADFEENWGSVVEHFGIMIDPDILKMGKKLGLSVSWLEEEISKRPKTIVHSDLKEDNLLFGNPNSDEAVLIIDWQTAIRSMGAFDVAYLMGGSEIVSELRVHHFDVLSRWHNTLLTEGVENYSWEDAVRDLKLGALASVCFRVRFHKAFIAAKGRSLDRLIVIFNRLSTLILEVDAVSVLP
jgi:hypothetical protein